MIDVRYQRPVIMKSGLAGVPTVLGSLGSKGLWSPCSSPCAYSLCFCMLRYGFIG